VHLRGDSFAASRVRACVPASFLVGRSVHSVADAVAATQAGGIDYLIFGTVFDSTSKPGSGSAGLGALAALAAATPIPVLAVGGMTVERARDAVAAGAAGIAAISMFDTLGSVP
jgi:thiamine-phosphate diphosphorylase